MKKLTRAASRWVAAISLAVIATMSLGSATLSAQSPAPVPQLTSPSPAVQAQTPEEFYRSVWQAVKDNFLWQDRMTDWHKWERKFDGKLKTHADAETAIAQMLSTLNDGYTYFKDKQLTKARGDRDDQKGVVTYKMLANDIGYIRIRTFSSNHTAPEFEAALKGLTGAKAYVIDLRDNGGGYVWQAFHVFSMLCESGTFTEMRGWYGGAAYVETLSATKTELKAVENGKTTTSTRPAFLAGTKPITVLVNGNSASASEMLTGALKDNKRATVVGTLTYGKGIAQITKSLERDTSVQVTFAEYYFPNGASIHKKGITPDTTVQPSSKGDAQLDEAEKILLKELGK